MPVLSRRVDEQILVPELGIAIRVCQIKGGRVRIEISAPDEVKIIRGELSIEDKFANLETWS